MSNNNEINLRQMAKNLAKQASGGKVASSSFLAANESSTLAAYVRDIEGVEVSSHGGVLGAQRQVVSVFPPHIPSVTPALAAVYIPDCHDVEALKAALARLDVAKTDLGDAFTYEEGTAVILLRNKLATVLTLTKVERDPVQPVEIDLTKLETQNQKNMNVVVPSLRVDALGAKAFGVSRSYFSKGIASGNVTLNGKPAGKASSAEVGDDIIADGLGRMKLEAVEGTTKKGNYKVVLHIERFKKG